MENQDLQIVNDEIMCYKKAIDDVDDKLKLLKFLYSVDTSIGKSLNLDNDELLDRKTKLKNNLKELMSKKTSLTGNNRKTGILNINVKTQNSFLMSNYLSFINNFDNIKIRNAKNSDSND